MSELTAAAEEEIRRLRWQCRRGMLELDHLFMRFVDLGYRDLDAQGKARFRALLGQQDTDLSDWFMSRREPEDPQVRDLVRHILSVVALKPA